MSIAISHNMDNITSIDQDSLAKYMGLTKTKDGASTTTGAVCDASGSKRMEVDNTGNINYWYRRGGVTLKATINVSTQSMTWEASGIDNTSNRKTALREGLKLAEDTDLTVQTNDLWT